MANHSFGELRLVMAEDPQLSRAETFEQVENVRIEGANTFGPRDKHSNRSYSKLQRAYSNIFLLTNRNDGSQVDYGVLLFTKISMEL